MRVGVRQGCVGCRRPVQARNCVCASRGRQRAASAGLRSLGNAWQQPGGASTVCASLCGRASRAWCARCWGLFVGVVWGIWAEIRFARSRVPRKSGNAGGRVQERHPPETGCRRERSPDGPQPLAGSGSQSPSSPWPAAARAYFSGASTKPAPRATSELGGLISDGLFPFPSPIPSLISTDCVPLERPSFLVAFPDRVRCTHGALYPSRPSPPPPVLFLRFADTLASERTHLANVLPLFTRADPPPRLLVFVRPQPHRLYSELIISKAGICDCREVSHVSR